jgi:hypothetical protein
LLYSSDESPRPSPEQEVRQQGDPELEVAEPEGAEPEGAEPEGAEPEGAEPKGPESESAESQDAEMEDAELEDPESVDPVTWAATLLSERDDWPKWLVDSIDYLKDISEAETWVTLLANFVRLERRLGFAGADRAVSNPTDQSDHVRH